MVCPSCGASVAEGARFCATCGHGLERRSDERRVVTVLFADLVGFTSLSETLDPEQVKDLVDRCFGRLVADIGAFGGRVDKIIGDAIVALFGAPIAHEDDAERAVRAALRMQRTLTDWAPSLGASDLRMRIGINTGEVLVGALRAGGDYTAMGDVVNTAQRLQTIAEPGQVAVGQATHAATRRIVSYRSLGPVQAKGREEPVETWIAEEAVLPPGARPDRGAVPLVGRDPELELLGRAIDSAVRRSRAHLLLVIGEAGMGKTRVSEEVAAAAEVCHGAQVYEGRCLPYGEANVWWPVADALRSAAGLSSTDPIEVAREAVAARVGRALPELNPEEAERVLTGILHLFGYDGPLQGIDPARAREEVVRSVLAMIEGNARLAPVIVLLSDLHWADDVVLELADTILERYAALPVVLLGTARAALLDRWQPRQGRHNQLVLNLDALDREASGLLLDAMIEQPLPSDLRDLLLDRSGGNPFFLQELVALVEERGAATGVTSPSGIGSSADLPDTLRGLVAARLDTLTFDERCVLEDACVLGRRGPVMGLEIMAKEIDQPVRVQAAIAGLEAKDILEIDDGRWSFRSDLVREVAYGMLTKSDRARRHFGVADWMEHHPTGVPAEVDRIAHHYATSAALVNDIGGVEHLVPGEVTQRALEWLDRAVRQAELGELHLVTRRLASQALALGSIVDDGYRLRFLLARASAACALRDLDPAEGDLTAAETLADAAGDKGAMAKVLLGRGDLEQKRGDLEASGQTLQRATELFRMLDDQAGTAEAVRAYGMTRLFAGDDDGARTSFEGALAMYRELGDRRGEAWALQNLAWVAYTGGDPTSAEAWIDRSAAVFTEIGDAGGLWWAKGLLAYVRYNQGRFDEAAALAAEGLTEAQQRADRWAEGMMRTLLGLVALWTGRTSAAVKHSEVARSLFADMNDWFGLLMAVGVLGRSLVALGQVDDGFGVLYDGLAAAEAVPGDTARNTAFAQLHTAASQAGTPDRIASLTDDTQDSQAEGTELGWLDWWIADAMLALQRGDADVPLERLERLVGGPVAHGYAAAAMSLARAVAGDVEGAREANTIVASSDNATYSDRVMGLLGAGLAIARDGGRSSSAAALRTARELVDATEDYMLQAVVRLAEARVAELFEEPDAAASLREAQLTLAAMGVTQSGWDTLIRRALGTLQPGVLAAETR